ncbi:MAG: ABC transporter ATP-binding protein/permease [Ruminococcaceae bacterium]|nr:ABC transporter ATP-binding protein/permease [Oscillospiraceae bacterium]
MLELKNITKDYYIGETKTEALRGVSLSFRKSEFVSILGPSGCGKTTLLNIIGGLDRYTDGDLIINEKSTKDFKDSDWDAYRNHSIGFVFQSYNLIPHQNVLSNVELALTLSGVSKHERRQRAKEALEMVGLGDQLNKKPNQMSGGQMQRVAIARALVNDPDILLADEPTGALDSVTSVQIMEILKKVAEKRLVIMVTHNPELAEQYSTRIVRLRDGVIVSDSSPFDPAAPYNVNEISDKEASKETSKKKENSPKKAKNKKERKPSMSFWTALSLSFNNLMTKRARTVLTSFAGSIGIIGIALILAVSQGVSAFIDSVQEDTLSAYPLSLQKETQNMAAMLAAMTSVSDTSDYKDTNKIYVDDSLGTMMQAMASTIDNNLEAFKVYLDKNYDKIKDYISDIQYTYDYDMHIFNADGSVEVGMETLLDNMGDAFSGFSEMASMSGSMNVFSEMINNQTLLDQQYEVVAGSWPTEANEVVLVVNSNNSISKMALYMLGVLPHDDLEDIMKDLMTSGKYDSTPMDPYDFDFFLNMKFKLLLSSDFYAESDRTYTYEGNTYNVWNDTRLSPMYNQAEFIKDRGIDIKVSGIIRPKEGATATSISGVIGYTKALTDYVLAETGKSEVIAQQKATPTVNVLTGLSFERTHYTPENIHELINKIDNSTMEQFYAYMTEMIKTNPELSEQVKVTKDNFAGMFMLMPIESQAEILTAAIAAANANDPVGTATLFTVISGMTGNKITVTADNFVMLLPSLDMSHVYTALAGMQANEYMPISVKGLAALAGEEVMGAIYGEMTAMMLELEVNEDIFVNLLATLKADDENFIQIEETLYNMAPQIDATFESILDELDAIEAPCPASINFYAKDFESKEAIEKFIADYNDSVKEADKIEYTDVVGIMMSSVTTIINAITYVLIAFVAISLIVSSIMIGVITLISVQERTKEIGILRAIGASKRDVSGMFNAETMIVGFSSGLLGVVVTYLLCIPINLILYALTDIANLRAFLPWQAAVVLVVISVLLTLISGIIPSRSAAKKDPVVALRTE